jgi:hypothetical protein
MNPHPFAPGAIQRHRRPAFSLQQRRAIKRWLLISAAFMASAAFFGLLAGLITRVIAP